MTNGKNSFLQVVKLPNVRGRVRYISDPKRQENLYATFTNVEPKYWTYLSKENQEDFRKSGTEGKCIEARELIIMLPPSLIQYDPDMLLKYFSAKFVEKYDVAVVSALHHNKAKTNLHIHLIFSERQAFDVPERKIAARNLFYAENGKHVRTKKEILDERGEIRPGCRIVKKGEVYETNLFKPKNQEFKSKKFTEEMKYYYTDLINELVKDPAEKLKVFDKNSPYLPTRKIGKNNPKAEEIRIDNYLRQEWNHMVDRAVTEGVTEEELCQVKKKEITVPAQESIMKEGWKPDQFRKILQKAIGKLRGFIQFMKEIRNGEFDARGNPLIRHDLRFDVTPAPLSETAKGERPSSALQEAKVMRLDHILQKKKAQQTLSEIPKMQEYENALEVKKAYKAAVTELKDVRKLQSEWEQKGIPEKKYWVIKANVPEQTKQKSIHERLEEKKRDVEQKQKKERKRSHGRDCL